MKHLSGYFVAALSSLAILSIPGGAALAQGVYVSKGQNGPVFSDKPQPGAKEVTLPPLNVMTLPKEVKMPDKASPEPPAGTAKADAQAASYRSFVVVSPESDGSVIANTALFEVRVAVDPPLQIGDGHAFTVRINGRAVRERFTATEFTIPPEFWGDTLPPANQSMQLDASIVDANGRVLKTAPPVSFFMRYATVLNQPRRPLHRPAVPPKAPPPVPKPALEPARETGK